MYGPGMGMGYGPMMGGMYGPGMYGGEFLGENHKDRDDGIPGNDGLWRWRSALQSRYGCWPHSRLRVCNKNLPSVVRAPSTGSAFDTSRWFHLLRFWPVEMAVEAEDDPMSRPVSQAPYIRPTGHPGCSLPQWYLCIPFSMRSLLLVVLVAFLHVADAQWGYGGGLKLAPFSPCTGPYGYGPGMYGGSPYGGYGGGFGRGYGGMGRGMGEFSESSLQLQAMAAWVREE